LAATTSSSGIVQRYFEDIQMGTIKGIDAMSYAFKRADWISSSEPQVGIKVSFELQKETAVKVRVEE
jgi:hypothetical protein